ncbi:hypothetical protein [Flavobacterium hungaricum]|uniref:Lipoprotein n=1 Tax=Flavobacterium hungaricum TaxID=2082725 RepID=A0ABR9TN23_9FLAO|nr:hypothetical protein [Flavobacterium hungaricum]MBE8726417.1 hypothetical protein [Flavobacterium hungaricum]
MELEKFQSKYTLLFTFLFFVSCTSNKERAMLDADGEFNYYVNDLNLDVKDFTGPIILKKDDKNFQPRRNHILYGWKSNAKKKTAWIYVEVDTTFEKEPSVSYSDDFFKIMK